MPDAAFVSTESHFVGLLEAASGPDVIEVRRHTMDGVVRGADAAARIRAHYTPLADLFADPPDVLIVTGSNPIQAHIEDEPYWIDMVDLITFAAGRIPLVLLSCLSAHAALVALDGLKRDALIDKCTGVFAQEADPLHYLCDRLVPPLVLPHSRRHGVPSAEVRDAGYRIALGSRTEGWSVATKRIGATELVLVQGHPEYGPDSLLREYHRDVRRYVNHEREECPPFPNGCVSVADADALSALQARVVEGARDQAVVEAFDFAGAMGRAPWTWRPMAITMYENWLAGPAKGSA